MSTPPTSPQRAQNAARQAKRDQHLLGSPPFRWPPYPQPPSPPHNVPAAFLVSISPSTILYIF